jgi:hypothetical protein
VKTKKSSSLQARELHGEGFSAQTFNGTPVENTSVERVRKPTQFVWLWKTSRTRMPFLQARLPRSLLQRIRLGNGGDNLRRRALRRNLARMLPQFGKRHTAYSVRNQNSESQRRQRRTYQHQHIRCILHIPNALLGFAEGPSRVGLDAPTRRPDTLSSHLIPNRCATR